MKRKLNFEKVICAKIEGEQVVFEFAMACEGHCIERYFVCPFPFTPSQLKYRVQKALKDLRVSFAVNKWERKKLTRACSDALR
jgi:hypothetical protein